MDTTPINRPEDGFDDSTNDATKITFLVRLRELPEKRTLPWQVPSDKSTDSPRVQQRGAYLLATRGHVAEVPCDHCARGNGRFTACITMYPWFQGACSTCIFTSKANRCSLRVQTIGKADGRALRHTIMDKLSPSQPRSSSKKRKGYSSAAKKHSILEDGFSDFDALLQAQIAQEKLDGRNEQFHAAEAPQKAKNLPWGQLQNLSSITELPIKHPHGTGVNYSTAVPGLKGPQDSVTTPLEKFQNACPTIKSNFTAINASKPDWSYDVAAKPPPPIQTFPSAQQRKTLGLICEIQSGILHLQEQLNALQAVLGIESESLLKDE